MTKATPMTDNPLLQPWTGLFETPDFEGIAPHHFAPAFEVALAEHRREIEAIARDPAAPSFANTIEALERAGRSLQRVSAVFYNLCSAHTNPALQAIERDMAPVLARHRNAIHMNAALFARIDRLVEQGGALALSDEQARLLERYHTTFVRNGAALDAAGKARLAQITERLAVLGTRFAQNVLADEQTPALVLEREEDLAGLPDVLRREAAAAAAARDLPGKYVITCSRSSIEPFLQCARRRDLREAAFKAWIGRGERGGESDNRALAAEMVRLRAERARLLGFPTFAHFRLDDSMAKTPQAALSLLRTVWDPARAQALREQAALQACVHAEGGNFELAAWDWRYYAEQRRKAEFDFDDGALKPYLALERVIAAAFDTASRLFGLVFLPRKDVPVYHPDVRAWEVRRTDGRAVGLFLGDYFARPSKRGGAWMSAFRSQERLVGDVRPIIVNVMNFSPPADGAPALLSFEDARTLFHEFGHALHGLLSDVTYPTLAGTNVARDFVELPSQLFEHWLERPEILRRHAVHHATGEPMPEALLERVLAARSFNQGFAAVEYLACALADLELHLREGEAEVDITAFERAVLAQIGMPPAIAMRHRLPHFLHLFAGDAYAAGYYAYMWSEVLDADGFDAFEEAGDVFDPGVARRLHDFIYAAGNLRDPALAYRLFRGRDPTPQALLRRRGLIAPPAQGEV